MEFLNEGLTDANLYSTNYYTINNNCDIISLVDSTKIINMNSN
jgi:hypothetical protein